MSSENFNSWLVVDFDYGKSDLSDLHKYQDELESIVNNSGLGEVDGNEVAVDLSDGAYFIIGKNADEMYELIKESLTKTSLVKVKEIKKRDAGEDDYTTLR